MRTISCYKLEAISDSGPNSLVARFGTKSEAEKAAPSAGGYGPNIVSETIVIYETAIEFNPKLNATARASGLAKLTAEERLALGIEL